MSQIQKNILVRNLREGRVSFNIDRNGIGYIRQKESTGHHADHKAYFLFDSDGDLIGSQPIDERAAHLIIHHFEKRGSTEAFYLTQEELANNEPLDYRPAFKMTPSTVRHKDTKSERSYTAVGEKLNYHWPIFKKLRDTGYGSLIRGTMTLHQVCSSHCQFCSTIMRNRSDSISLEEAKEFVIALHDEQIAYNRQHFPEYNDLYKSVTGQEIGLQGLILSGGGQPNLWPHFEEFVKWLRTRDIDLGLITNGFPKKVDESIYENFTWIRLSVTPAEASPFYPAGRFEDQYIPKNLLNSSSVTMGLSYVYGPWTENGMLERLDAAAVQMGFDYCRLLTDCNLTRSAQLRAHQELSEALYKSGLIDEEGAPKSKIFHQLKYHGDPLESEQTWPEGQCMLQSYNVFWDTTGHDKNGDSYCYPCDSVTVLADEKVDGTIDVSARRFNPEKWGTVRSKEIRELYQKPLRPWFDPRAICQSCLFVNNNRKVRNLANLQSYEEVAMPNLKHLNFP